MVTYSEAIYIDESGNGAPTNDIHSYWVSAAVSVAFDQTLVLNEGVRRTTVRHFRPFVKELKGSSMPRYLLPTSSVSDVARDLGDLLERVHARMWVAASRHGAKPFPGISAEHPRSKDVVRSLLIEMINCHLAEGSDDPDHSLIIWDISHQQELQDFSASIANFRTVHGGIPRCEKLAPAALGGLSHDWGGLQSADVVAHCALHYLGREDSLSGARADKCSAFITEFMPRLHRRDDGAPSGWMVWV